MQMSGGTIMQIEAGVLLLLDEINLVRSGVVPLRLSVGNLDLGGYGSGVRIDGQHPHGVAIGVMEGVEEGENLVAVDSRIRPDSCATNMARE